MSKLDKKKVAILTESGFKTDLINAIINWIDKDDIINNELITSQSTEDLCIFNQTIIEEFAHYIHQSSIH